MSLGAGHSPTHTLPPIMWAFALQGSRAQPHSHLVRPPPHHMGIPLQAAGQVQNEVAASGLRPAGG